MRTSSTLIVAGTVAVLLGTILLWAREPAASDGAPGISDANRTAVAVDIELKLEAVDTVGVLEGDSVQSFGHVIDVARDEHGTLFVLDAIRNHLVVFDSAGGFLSSTGRRGGGPGEFAYPTSLDLITGQQLVVLDQGNARISIFQMRHGEITHIDDSRLEVEARDLCTIGDRIYVSGFHKGAFLHEIDSEGEIIHSFGEPFLPDVELGRRITLSRLACDAGSQSILLTSMQVSSIHVYTADGDLRWRVDEIEGYSEQVITYVGGGTVEHSAPRDGGNTDVTMSVVPVDGRLLLVQFGPIPEGLRNFEDLVDVDSRLYSLATGALVASTDELPRIDEASGDVLLSHVSDPFPRVVTYRFEIRQ